MWIHIPSQFVADMAASSWDLEQLSQELESSATWKTKSLKAKSWRNVLKTESLTTVLSGLIYDPLMRQLGVERFISSLEGSPASLIALRERSEDKTTQENSQEKYSVLPTNWGDQLSFLRMFQESDGSTGTTSDQDYKRWDTELRKSSLQREKQGHHIKGSDYSSWPTPDTQNFRDGSKLRRGSYMNHSISLHHKAAYWPTVTAQEVVHEDMKLTETNRRKTKDGKDSHSMNLQDRSRTWPTPNASEHKFRLQGNTQQSSGLTATVRKSDIHSTHQDPTTTKDGHTCSPTCRRLNPHFAEWLMGLPRGWTSSLDQLEMELFQLQQLELSFYLASVLNK